MRVEPHTVDSVVHAIKRGARGLPIVRDNADRVRFVRLLFYLNDEYRDEFWERSVITLRTFERPSHWPERRALVHILAWTLMPNHFHLVLRPAIEGGVSKFMQRVCGSMTTHFNAKYDESGSIFQGSYRGRTADIHGDEYLRHLAVYVMVKNPFELFKGGIEMAIRNFDQAYAWAQAYRFCSLGEFTKKRESPILERNIFVDLFGDSGQFKLFARDCMRYKLELLQQFVQV